MSVNYPHSSTNLFGRSVCNSQLMRSNCRHYTFSGVCKLAHKIPTDSRPLKSLAAGFGVWADTTADKEGSQ